MSDVTSGDVITEMPSQASVTPMSADVVPMPADAIPELDAPLMTPDQFSRELMYQVSLHFVKSMLDEGIISSTDFDKWQALLLEQCDPPIGRIVSNKR